MPKNNTPIRLVKSPQQWLELDDTIAHCVSTLCARYDDPEQVRSFLTLVDMMTNKRYEAGDRESVAFEAQRQAFQYAPEFYEAQEQYMNKLVIPAKERKTA